MYHRTASQDETATQVHASAVRVRGVRIIQKTNDAPKLYLQLFDHASPTVGTTKPEVVLTVPAGYTNQDFAKGGVSFHSDKGGEPFDTALSMAVTTTPDGNTGPDAGDEPEVIIEYNEKET